MSDSVEPAGRFVDGISIGVLTRLLHRDLVDEVLLETGRVEKRSRLLPARVVVYYVVALCLFFGSAYEEVMRQLVGGLRYLGNWGDGWKIPTDSAISQARKRLGEEPLRELFERVAVPMARPGTRGAWFHGLRIMAIDGVMLHVPDTPENVAAFDKRRHATGKNAWPQVRVVGLVECGTHAMVAAAVDQWAVMERELTERMLPAFEPGMLVLADRGFYSHLMWRQAQQTGADLLWRLSENLTLPMLEWLPDGSYRSEIIPPEEKRMIKIGHLDPSATTVRMPVRVIEYTVTNRDQAEIIRLITTIEDHQLAPAVELAALYAQRWEFELTLDEIKTHQLGKPRILRSKLPELVRQEIWALLLAHYAVRSFMREAADDLDDIDVDRLSFTRSINIIRRQATSPAAFSPSTPSRSHPRNNH